MDSIKKKILMSFFTTIGILTLLIVLLGIVSIRLINKYEEISNIIVLEQSLADEISGLAEEAYNGFQTNDYGKYYEKLGNIKGIETKLDTQPNSTSDFKIAYRSVKNSLNSAVNDIEDVKNNLEKSGDITGISGLYQETTTKFDYAKQNIDNLILVETKVLAQVTQGMQKTRGIMTSILVIIIVCVLIGISIYVVIFSKKITEPIISLSEIARRIAEKDLNVNVQENLLDMKDEIGSLSVSFDLMVNELRTKIDKEKAFNEILGKSKKEIESRNKELETSNKLFVDRELKMIEMKKSIAELEEKLKNKNN